MPLNNSTTAVLQSRNVVKAFNGEFSLLSLLLMLLHLI